MDIKFRKSKKEDLPAILNILNSVSGDARNVNPEQFLLAEHNNKIVGCARIKEVDGKFELASLAVLPEYRKQGIGTSLVKKMLANKPDKRPLYLLCHKNNEDFYRRLGFKTKKPENLQNILKKDYNKFLKHRFAENPELLIVMILTK